MVARWVADGHSPFFTLDESHLDAVADYVAEVTREAYPDLAIPYHSRWRHFCAGSVDRWKELSESVRVHPLERARMAVDLVTVSVLLDAGAGDAWHYREAANWKCLLPLRGSRHRKPRHVSRRRFFLGRRSPISRR